jgi:hypothetical protein
MTGTALCCLILVVGGEGLADKADTPEPLVLWPDSIGKLVDRAVHCTDRPFGYSAKELAYFPGRTHRLAYVDQLFRDAPRLPIETDRVGRELLAGGFERAIRTGCKMLAPGDWKVDQSKEITCQIVPADDASKKIWEGLPAAVRQGVEDLVRAAQAARPHLHRAFDWNAVARRVGDRNVGNLGMVQVYDHAAAPWTRPGRGSHDSFAALSALRPDELARAGAVFAPRMRRAIETLCQIDKETPIPKFDACQLRTTAGSVRILGPGANTYRGRDAIVVDLGGNDVYTGRVAVPRSKGAPVGLLVDLGGNDVYDGRQAAASIACGLYGIGALFDLGGNDRYLCRESALGCAWYGIGLLVDTRGTDTYSGFRWCQGAAHAGVGILIDEQGDDRYTCQLESQGLGGTLGVGMLIDAHGNDRYHANDNEGGRTITVPSPQSKSHEVSMVQGAGYGRRADDADRRYLAGGVGVLVDGDGDDSYYGGVFSQGIGYWWSAGMLIDFGGDDRYRGVYYAQGAAAHFAVGALVDRGGDDRYNDRGILGQVLGAGRDGAVATFVDTSGNDTYYVPKKSAGGGDMNSIGLFCDQQGDDAYHVSGYSYLGAASSHSVGRELFRQRISTIGVFLDLAGKDQYPSHGRTKNNAAWYHQSSPMLWGYGLDTDVRRMSKPKTESASEEVSSG